MLDFMEEFLKQLLLSDCLSIQLQWESWNYSSKDCKKGDYSHNYIISLGFFKTNITDRSAAEKNNRVTCLE